MTACIRHLAAEEIIRVHDLAVEVFGGLPGVVSHGKVEALIARVINFSAYEGIDDLYALAAMYCIAIARGHVFSDGNKRASMNSAILFLLRNGVRLRSVPGLDDVIVRTAAGEMRLPELAEYFRKMPQTVLRR